MMAWGNSINWDELVAKAITAIQEGRTRGQFISENCSADDSRIFLQLLSDSYTQAMNQLLMENKLTVKEANEIKIQDALRLIKLYITEEHTNQNRDLHEAVQLIVSFARAYDHCKR